MIKDTQFYNKESAVYSEKRYPKVPTHYTPFFFTERLRLTIQHLQKILGTKENLSLLEIGCADGVVAYEIQQKCPTTFSHIVGIDISPGMIEAAQQKFGMSGITFMTRDVYTDQTKLDVIVEIGVINYTSLESELEYIAMHLKVDGFACISLAGTGSLWDRTRRGETGFATFLSYKEYDEAISEKFAIVESIPVGLPIPFIWRIPILGRGISYGVETLLRPIFPNLFHEKIYIIKHVSNPQG